MHLYLYVSSKNVTLRDEVYKKLKEAERADESFSDAIERLLEHKDSLQPLWCSLSGHEALELIRTDLNAIRSEAKVRM